MDQTLLVSELQSLIAESKRRHPEVKEAAEHALELLKTKSAPREQLLQEHGDKLLAPVTLGCKTKQSKVIGISLGVLQRLLVIKAVPTDALPQVYQTLNSVINQAVEIQLKILQTILSILSNDPDVHNDVLGNALLICFKLQDSRVSVVSSTAAASLRQAVMVVFDRIAKDTSKPLLPLKLNEPEGEQILVTPAALDAFNIFSDLCLLTAKGSGSGGFSLWGKSEDIKPALLKLNSLQRTFGLELVESILSGYETSVKQHPELLHLLSHSLDPLLLQLLGEKPSFPIALRVCRLIFLLIRSFTEQLPLQAETYLSTLIRLAMGGSEGEETTRKDVVPPWLRGLALEILRGICGDVALLRTVWTTFDQAEGSHIFSKIIASLGKLVNEKPALLGIGSQMHGLGVPHSEAMSPSGSNQAGGYLDLGIGMVASAASAGINTVGSMMGAGGSGLGPQSGMKLKLIEQHDKVEAPPIPETYVYLLALQSLDAVAEGLYVAVGQSDQIEKPMVGMAESAWPALLAGLSYCLGTNLSDNLFAEVLSAVQDFTVACGLLKLNTPRDAFISTLGKYAVPPPVVSAMQSFMEGGTHSAKSGGGINADSIGLGILAGGQAEPPSLSKRNLACLRSIVTSARILASSLDDAWHDILEILQNANFLLVSSRPSRPKRNPTGTSPRISQSPTLSSTASEPDRPEIFDDLDTESIQNAINILFDGSRDMDDQAFMSFVSALRRLSSEMIGLGENDGPAMTDAMPPPSSPMVLMSPGGEGKRRASGLNISHSIKSGERSFSLTKLRIVAMINLNRLVTADPEIGWDPVSQHLLAVARHPTAPTTIRLQASDALGELLLGAIRVGKESRTQHQVFDVLVRQVAVEPISKMVTTDYDVRSSGYSTLNQILESSGHSLEVGWKPIFGMLSGACPEIRSSTPHPSSLSKSNANLVRIAFPSLNLICTDFLSSLDPDAMQDCITCLVGFGRQQEDVNIALAAIGLLWNISDAVQSGSNSSGELWLHLLSALLDLGRDPRLEVRSSAMQTLFRCVELHGSTLSTTMWEDVLGKIIFPLLEAAKNDEGAILALTSVGNIFNLFLPSFTSIATFRSIYPRFLTRIQDAFANEPRKCGTAALKAVERVLVATTKQDSDLKLEDRDYILDSTWASFTKLSESLDASEEYTQENLIALVRIGSQLHDQITWTDDRLAQFSRILRGVMTYSKSPEYRHDVDVMSPLQTDVTNLISGSRHLGAALALGDLAEFASLTYMRDDSGRLSFVAVSKFAMPKMAELFLKHAQDASLYEDGTVESVLGAYAIPIKLKYECPAASKYGNDQALWKTALEAVSSILTPITSTLDKGELSEERSTGVWTQVIEIFSGILLADNSEAGDTVQDDESFILPFLDTLKSIISPRLDTQIPDSLIGRYADVLRKGSQLYHFDVKVIAGGTTAPAIPDQVERIRYWAFDRLWEDVASRPSESSTKLDSTRKPVPSIIVPSLLKRVRFALRQYIDDARLRGQMPLGQVRDDELLYILRHLATLHLDPEVLPASTSSGVSFASSPRAHLFHFYTLLLEFAFLSAPLPSLWLFPSEHDVLFSNSPAPKESERKGSGELVDERADGDAGGDLDAHDGGDLIEVGARRMAKRCLELIGKEIGMSEEA